MLCYQSAHCQISNSAHLSMQWSGTFKNNKDSGRWDWQLIIFFLNVAAVVVGYSLREGSFQAIKLFRTGLVFVSLFALFLGQSQIKYYFDGNKNWVLWVFLSLSLAVMPFSVDFFWSIERYLAWIPFVVYVNYFIVYLFRQYTKDEAQIKLLQIFNIVYFLPVFVMIINGVMFKTENIYGQTVSGFIANVLGWACTLFVLTGFDLYANKESSKWTKYLFFITAILSLWGVVLTGSRSSYISLATATLVLVLRSRQISFNLKAVVSFFIFIFAYYIITSPDSVINLRSQYAEVRQVKGEARFELASMAFHTILKYPTLVFTGFGFDNFKAGLSAYGGIKTELASHNSYLEIFFSSGIFTFLFFLIVIVGNAIIKYIKFDSQQFIYLPMLLIVPYFESNLNAGQFLFFPWMGFLFYYVHAGSLQFPVSDIE